MHRNVRLAVAALLSLNLSACSTTSSPPPPDALPDTAMDAATLDGGSVDASPTDAGLPDAMAPDAMAPDATIPDASIPDAPPCMCDDGLFCNGFETCADDGSCLEGVAPEPIDDGDVCTIPTVCNELTMAFDTELDPTNPVCGFTNDRPRVLEQDYAFVYRPGNHRPTETWPRVDTSRHYLTGHYGLVFDESAGDILNFGALVDTLNMSAARLRPNSVLEGLADATLRFTAGDGTRDVTATTFRGADEIRGPRVGQPSDIHHDRMIDGGRFMNRTYIPQVAYAGDDSYRGEVQVASMPRHIALTHTAQASSWGAMSRPSARIEFSGAALTPLSTATWLVPNRAVKLTDASGEGWVFIVYDATGSSTTLTRSADGTLSAERVASSLPAAGEISVSLVAVPTHAVSDAELDVYLQQTSPVSIEYTLLRRDGTSVGMPAPVSWDERLGAYRVNLRTLQESGAPRSANYEMETYHTWYGRHQVRVTTTGTSAIGVPMAFFGTDRVSWYITGGVAILRDSAGEPLGVPVQISKNWHERGNNWYHFYSHPTFAAASDTPMELTIASSRWGQPYAASHAQLSLIGWSTSGGHWDESALGAFGESVTYDPDKTLGRAMMDDVRPFLVQADRKWSWTGNVGGADFLRYRTEREHYWERRLARVRSTYASPGPNLTDVMYSGVSTNGAIQADIRTQLTATDDVVRVYQHFDYTFLQDVEYRRLAFFQVAADNYADNDFGNYAYGNASAVTFNGSVPAHGTTGYASDADRGIALSGDAPWVFLYNNRITGDALPERYGNVGFVVRNYEARVGTAVLTTPYINIHRTNNRHSQMAFEVGLPYDETSSWCGAPCMGRQRFIPMGSRVSFTIEYLVAPADKSVYYGASSYLRALPAASYQSPAMMQMLARDNQITVTPATGTLARTYPVEIDVADGGLAADFTMAGGLGYTPISFRGLIRHDGWKLESLADDGTWSEVDLEVEGNDFWQTSYNPTTERYTLTYSVPNSGTTRYRLRWAPMMSLP